jgi:hypothetical protein
MSNMMASPTPITKHRDKNNKRADTKNLPNLEWRKMSDRQHKEKYIIETRKE